MAVAPLNLPGYAAPQAFDFTSLANLGQVYKKSQDDALVKDTLANLGQGGQVDGTALLRSGNLTLAQMGQNILNRQQDQERQARLDQRQTSRDAVDDNFRNQSLSLQRAAAARAAADKFEIKEVTDQNTGATSFVRIKTTGGEGPVSLGLPQPSTGGGNPFMNGPQGKLTEGEGKAQGFADRMLSAEGILSGKTAETGIGPVTPGKDIEGSGYVQRGIESSSGIPGASGAANYVQSKEYQQFKQARDNFINSQLRRESGAAISKDEYIKADAQYFPVPGDSPEVIEQKRQNRADTIRAMGREGGRTYRPRSVPDPGGGMRPTQPNIAPSQEQAAAPTIPQPGELRDGFRFRGGNPADPASWAKAQ